MFEKTTFGELSCKEVINVCDGARMGNVCDLELDLCSGAVLALIVPGQTRCFGLIRGSEDVVIPFCHIKKIGEDVILVELRP